jgi:hypothetical protein
MNNRISSSGIGMPMIYNARPLLIALAPSAGAENPLPARRVPAA